MPASIRIKRGLRANLPALMRGEQAYCEDTGELYIGSSSGNVALCSAGGWPTARNLTLTGDITGSVSIKGDSDMTLNTTLVSGGTVGGDASVKVFIAEPVSFSLAGTQAAYASVPHPFTLEEMSRAHIQSWLRCTSAATVTSPTLSSFTFDTGTLFPASSVRQHVGSATTYGRPNALIPLPIAVRSNTLYFSFSDSVSGTAHFAATSNYICVLSTYAMYRVPLSTLISSFEMLVTIYVPTGL